MKPHEYDFLAIDRPDLLLPMWRDLRLWARKRARHLSREQIISRRGYVLLTTEWPHIIHAAEQYGPAAIL